ncbi:MAG: hypothetical protein HGB14_07425 [Anaerolineaceae bacterium]|nr:hypothetical protein [Anaerolineaceae bacterium]
MKHFHLIKVSLLLTIILFVSLFNIVGQSVHAAVTLVRFEVVNVSNNAITLEWETASEFNNLGFFVQRSDTEGGTYEQIGDFIPAEGTGVSGFIYQFTDDLVQNDRVYFYKLEAIDLNTVSEFFGPVSNGVLTTPTLTITLTRTNTLANTTLTPQITSTATISVTATTSPTATETSPFSFFTNTATDTRTVTPLVSSTNEILGTETITVSETPTKIVVKTSTSNVPTIEETPVVDRESKQKSAWRTLAIGFFSVLFLGGLSIWGLLFYTKRKTGTD